MRIAPCLGRFSLRTIRILFSRLVPSGCKVKCMEFWRIWGVTKRPASEISHGKDSKTQPLGTRLTYPCHRAEPIHLAISHSRAAIFRAFHSRLFPGFQLFSVLFSLLRSGMEERNCVYRPGNGRGVHARSKATTTSEPMSPKFIGNSISVV